MPYKNAGGAVIALLRDALRQPTNGGSEKMKKRTQKSDVSHDVKGLMTQAFLAVDLLDRHDLEPVRKQAGRIQRALEKMSKICAQEFAPREKPITFQRHVASDLTRILSEAFDVVGTCPAGFSLQASVLVPSDLALTMDARSLLRVLNDFVSGASTSLVRHGSLSMSVAVSQVENEVLFDVRPASASDCSKGKPKAASLRSQPIEIGVSRAHRLAKELGGDIFLLTDTDGAPAFQLRLPYRPDAPEHALPFDVVSDESRAC